MPVSPIDRLEHIKSSIAAIRAMLAGRDFERAYSDHIHWRAFERELEIVSEASRKVPDAWKQEFAPDLPWRQIANIGNFLRHAYSSINAPKLWAIYTHDLDPLEAAIDAMLAANPPPPEHSTRSRRRQAGRAG